MAFLGKLARQSTCLVRCASISSAWKLHRFPADGLCYSTHARILGPDGLPVSVDWRREGAVTDIQDQNEFDHCFSASRLSVKTLGQDGLLVNKDGDTDMDNIESDNNGVCWAYAIAGAVEGANYIMTKQLIKLSEAQLINCVDVNCCGLEGGHEIPAYKYIIQNGGLVPRADYPCVGYEDPTHPEIRAYGVTISNYVYYRDVPENLLKRWVAKQPIVAVLGADQSFHTYDGGVLDGPSYTLSEMRDKKFEHTVLLVGYDTDPYTLEDYWIGKNSWSEDWGELGFFRIARNKGRAGGALGMNRFVSYPIKGEGDQNGMVCVKKESSMGAPWIYIPSHRFGMAE